jgi:hypothetical protein
MMRRIVLGALFLFAVASGFAVTTTLAAPDFSLPKPFTFEAINPCTNQPTLVTLTYTSSVINEIPTKSGLIVTGVASGFVSSTDGFSGRFNTSFAVRALSSQESEQFSMFQVAHGPNGQTLIVHETAHVLQGRTAFERVTLRCVGGRP